MQMRFTRTSVKLYESSQKDYPVIKATILRVGMRSVNLSIELSCSILRETTQVWLLQLYLPNLTGNGGMDGPLTAIHRASK